MMFAENGIKTGSNMEYKLIYEKIWNRFYRTLKPMQVLEKGKWWHNKMTESCCDYMKFLSAMSFSHCFANSSVDEIRRYFDYFIILDHLISLQSVQIVYWNALCMCIVHSCT